MRFARLALPTLATVLVLIAATPGVAAVPVTQVSADPYTNAASQHRTEVEPDTFVAGSTIVSAFQVGRIPGGGAANIGFARSANNGATWTNGFLPATTTVATPPGTFSAISDPAVAFDAR
ncbi:MAG TPA: exo-alpha-sialidase, partial [Actinomycetes bacterium]|nr:exo-alpha-sialidase [Actinomycetes bacterium]